MGGARGGGAARLPFSFVLFPCSADHERAGLTTTVLCVCVYVFFPFILGNIKFVGRTSRGHTVGSSHRISRPPSFCGACLNFSREKEFSHSFPSSTVK